MTSPSRPLPANRAFVVQFRAQSAGEPFRCEGRAEHLVSGQSIRFASQDELWAFIHRVLTDQTLHMEEPRP